MKKSILFISILLIFLNLEGQCQTYIGVSANIGNQLSFNPSSTNLNRPIAVSGNLELMKYEHIGNNWFIQYGLSIGTLGYEFKVDNRETFGPSSYSSYWDYSTFYGSLDLELGREFRLNQKKLSIGLGAGLTYYFFTYSNSYTISKVNDNFQLFDLFYSELEFGPKTISASAQIITQLELNQVLSIGASYKYHFTPALEGYYEFYYPTEPSSGDVFLYQREFKLYLLIRVSKKQ